MQTDNFWTRTPRPIIGLSPMDGVTDASFRLITAKYGRPDIFMTEFTSVEGICAGADGFIRDFAYSDEERPIIAQIYGRNSDHFYKVAHIVCELGFDGVDINMGCPAKNVAAKGCGAGLILNPSLAVTLMRSVRSGIMDWVAGQPLEGLGLDASVLEHVNAMSLRHRNPVAVGTRHPIPMSVKTRVGYDETVVEDWVSTLLQESPAAISVHGRTLKQMYRGEADWQAIARAVEVARGTDTLVLGNGDLKSMPQVVRRVRETGVDGVLLGRAALGNPWIFRDKQWAKEALGRPVDAPERVLDHRIVTQEERTQVLLEHSKHFEGLWGVKRFPAMRKHLAWYCKGFRGAARWRTRLVQAKSVRDVEEIVGSNTSVASIGAKAEVYNDILTLP